jgi:anti-anti-sigma factor
MAIDVQVEETPRGLIVRMIGQASVDQIEELDRELHLLTALQPKFVVLEMSQVPYVSSMGIGSLLRFRNDIAQAGGRVVLAGLQKTVAETFKIGNIDRVLPMFDRVEDAK